MLELSRRILAGDQRALARAITWIEDEHEQKDQLLAELFPYSGKSHLVGITGSPGAGKSSLVSELVNVSRKKDETVAVLAVDPTSPFSGGALLGDRVRMNRHEGDTKVFFRSMGTRGSLGGLSEACQDVLIVMEAYGFDVIFVETVGVGQAELDIVKTADTVTLVLYPSGGDVIQAFKAGIMEISDVFAINKADLPGVSQLQNELSYLLDLTYHDADWRPPTHETVATTGEGMEKLYSAILHHREFLHSSSEHTERRLSQVETIVIRRFQSMVMSKLEEMADYKNQQLTKVRDRQLAPSQAAENLFHEWCERIEQQAEE
ncbi:methylmalonyl Co-A mutase-associated GTPase MeaB [Texcoconibacillus texcoconensis]|uniref:LAO/AO transport system kinase n=1 Tax=Texcoconibacillus texcoconensis TaxID=1095777 RepID=A0A840QS16_9BACI|nr:methylmalonyl Co-A mutase-associated GTPase MeaB [Texcoconibacillus texcoconensis]MBB5174113.1 LAO/AO transport system kinase [Texcoconibacillus texcoconensis]